MDYSTAKSNLDTQELTETIKAALLSRDKEPFMELLKIMEGKEENVEPIQRTGIFGAAVHIRPGDPPEERLQALLHKVSARIQEATSDGRTYTIEIKVKANLTVEPRDAKVGEYVHRDHFVPTHAHNNVIFEPPDGTERRTFQPTLQGYQRIE